MTSNRLPQWPAGQELQRSREHSGISKRQAAKNAGISSGYYRLIEDGSRINNGALETASPSPEVLRACAIAVGADTATVLAAAGVDPLYFQRMELNEAVNALPAEKVAPALSMVRGLLREL